MITEFLDYLRNERNRSPQTIASYDTSLRQFETFFHHLDANLDWNTVDADIIRDWLESLMDNGNMASGVKTRLSALKSFYRWALSRGKVAKDPAHYIEPPKAPKPLPHFLRESEMNRLLDDMEWGDDYREVRARTIIMTFYETGMRVSELTGLDDTDVDFVNHQVKVSAGGNATSVRNINITADNGSESVKKDSKAEGDVSQFGALATALAATIGTGNIVGVATAVALGGPGAVLWCWLTGIFGISTKYAEGLLAVKYRVKTADGRMLGGPMYALERGLGMKWLGILFAIFTALASFGIGCTVQANSIALLAHETFGVQTWIIGLVVCLLTASVILGGVKAIEVTNNGVITPLIKEEGAYLPEEFTIEYEFYYWTGGKDDIGLNDMKLTLASNTDRSRWAGYYGEGVAFCLTHGVYDTSDHKYAYNNGNGTDTKDTGFEYNFKKGWNQVAISFNKRALKV